MSKLVNHCLQNPDRTLALLAQRRERQAVRERAKSFAEFVKMAWHVLEPETPLKWGWAVEAICDHLEEVAFGNVTRLLINVPPGSMKSLLAAVFFPAWEWGPLGMAHLKHLTTSYKEEHAKRDARKTRELIQSDWYQAHWGDRVTIKRGGDGDFETTACGFRKARPIGSLTGDRGDRLIVDDPHSTEGAESITGRERTARLLRESLGTRLTDPKKSAMIVIMQRLHEDDASGILISEELGFEHLCLPMRFEEDRRCVTSIFEDPRQEEGELLFPERWDAETLDQLEKHMGPYAVAGQHQQRPAPRDGALFKREWFQIVDEMPLSGRACRAWDFAGSVQNGTNRPDWTVGLRGVRTGLHGYFITDMIRFQGGVGDIVARLKASAETDGSFTHIRLPQDPGGAGKCQADFFKSFLRNRHVISAPVVTDKVSRALVAAAIASGGSIKLLRGDWNDPFIEELCSFPRGRHDDIVDALSDLMHELAGGVFYDLSNVS